MQERTKSILFAGISLHMFQFFDHINSVLSLDFSKINR